MPINQNKPLEKDPGVGSVYFRKTKRFINHQGDFNVIRKGEKFHFYNTYQFLTNISWFHFLGLVVLTYLLINVFFATLYVATGATLIGGEPALTLSQKFAKAYYFSVQTLTTVGYGALLPRGPMANLIASFEALCGLLSFAMATGLLYGRFSRPNAKIRYSKQAIISPYGGITSFQFKIGNMRTSQLMDMKARVILTLLDLTQKDAFKKNFYELELETSEVVFFPLTWTVVHPIEESSPLYGLTPKELARLEAEFLILITGYDDAFNQIVHSRYSYDFNELVWNTKFKRNFNSNQDGFIVLEVDQIDELER